MEELEYMLKNLARNQVSLNQVVLTSEQFGMLNNLITAVIEVTREKTDMNADLNRKLRDKSAEIELLQRDGDLVADTMKAWQEKLFNHMATIRKEIERESDIAGNWVKVVNKEKDKNEFLESTLKDYSSKVASLRAEIGIANHQVLKLQSEKELLSENFKRLENTHEGLLEKCRVFKENYEFESVERKRDAAEWELKFASQQRMHTKEITKLREENNHLLNSLKETKDDLNRVQSEAQAKKNRDRSEDMIKSKEREVENLTKSLENLENKLAKKENEIDHLKKQAKTQAEKSSSSSSRLGHQTKQINSLEKQVVTLQKQLTLKEEELKDTLEKLQSIQEEKEDRPSSKQSVNDDQDKSHKLAIEILKLGTSARHKDKSALLANMFSISTGDVPKIKKSYLELLQAFKENKGESVSLPRNDSKKAKSKKGMDIEGSTRSLSRNSRNSRSRQMTPERNTDGQASNAQEYIHLDTAMKKIICDHTMYHSGCTGCEVSKPHASSTGLIKSKKNK